MGPIKQHGYTLIELIVVIIILGVLAATAMPKFADLARDARISAVEGVAAGITEASLFFHVKCLTSPTCNSKSLVSWFIFNGTGKFALYGYPWAKDINNNVWSIQRTIDTPGFTYIWAVGSGAGGTALFQMDTAPNSAACRVEYLDMTSIRAVSGVLIPPGIGAPMITTETSGC